MEPVHRGTPQAYPARRRGSVGSIQRGEDGSANGAAGSYPANGREHQQNDLLKTIYVSNITASMPDDALWEAFGQFGRVESLVRRDVNVDMNNNTEQQYAFIRFRNRQDARYAITAGEINFYGRKLVIRARDKPSYYKQNGYMNEKSREFEDKQRARQQTGIERRYDSRGQTPEAQMGFPMSPNNLPAIHGPGAVPAAAPAAEQLSKVLTVSNLPADMSPKELYDLFASLGGVERSYIFQQADALGRRFGEVTMSSFFFAQKACEGLHNCPIRNSILDVTYKAAAPALTNIVTEPVPPVNVARNYAWAIPHVQWPYHLYGGNGHALPPTHNNSYVQPNPGLVLPYAVWNGQSNPGGISNFNYGYPNAHMTPTQAVPLCVYPQQGSQPNFQRAHPLGISHSFRGPPEYTNIETATPNGLTPAMESASRSVSGASSATLVTLMNQDGILEKKIESPVIVMSPTYSEPLEKPTYDDEKTQADLVHQGTGPGTANSKPNSPEASPVSNEMTNELTQASTDPSFDPIKPPLVPENPKPRDPSNLYIKNLDDMYISTTMDLKTAFGQFGPIASAFLATYPNGVSKGFGFVAFVNPADAVSAKEQLDGVILGRKRVFVTFAERKEERVQRLRELFEAKKRQNADKKELQQGSESERGIQITNQVDLPYNTPRERPGSGGQPVDEANPEGIRGPNAIKELHQDIVGTTEGEVTVTTTVTTTKAWKGTQLHGIAEVEEEDAPSTKKFRQQRTQQYVQQSQACAAANSSAKDSRSASFSQNAPTSPNDKTSSSFQPTERQEMELQVRGSPVPAHQRSRTATGQAQRHTQNTRTGQRPFYPPGRGESASPKQSARRLDQNQVSMAGVPTGPRAQARSGAAGGAREPAAQPKKKRLGRRGGEVADKPTTEARGQPEQQLQHRSSSESPALRRGNSVDSDLSTTGAQFERLEVRSEP